MKLYTEEQVKIAYSKGNNDGYTGVFDCSIEELSLTSIELPSNEEIENIMISKYPHSVGVGLNHLIKSDERIGFEEGAKWMREQILNQKNK